jgi:hypothetical protein
MNGDVAQTFLVDGFSRGSGGSRADTSRLSRSSRRREVGAEAGLLEAFLAEP